MFGKITLIFLGLFVQEIISMNALVFATHQGVYPVLLTHALFVVGTIVDMGIGYLIGMYLRKKTSENRIGKYIQGLSERFSLDTKRYRRWFALLVLGNFSFPYINSCIAGYLDISFWESSVFILLGDVLSYVTVWLVVIGVHSVIKNIYASFGIVIGIAVVLLIVSNVVTGSRRK